MFQTLSELKRKKGARSNLRRRSFGIPFSSWLIRSLTCQNTTWIKKTKKNKIRSKVSQNCSSPICPICESFYESKYQIFGKKRSSLSFLNFSADKRFTSTFSAFAVKLQKVGRRLLFSATDEKVERGQLLGHNQSKIGRKLFRFENLNNFGQFNNVKNMLIKNINLKNW